MKRIIIAKILAASLLFTGCHSGGGGGVISDTVITTATSVAVTTYLHTVTDSAKCHAIANLSSGIAGTIRTITTTPPPTPAQLSTLIIAQIPQNLQTQYPEVVAFVVPLVVQGYEAALTQYGGSNQQQVYQILNDIATGVETGAATGCH